MKVRYTDVISTDLKKQEHCSRKFENNSSTCIITTCLVLKAGSMQDSVKVRAGWHNFELKNANKKEQKYIIPFYAIYISKIYKNPELRFPYI